MKENAKKYLEELIIDISIEANTIEDALNDIQKSLSKIRKFYNKVVKNL
jgi:hypothetical protein